MRSLQEIMRQNGLAVRDGLTLTVETPELRPCPFCGSINLGVKLGVPLNVRCLDCETDGPHAGTRQEAIAKWNIRRR